MNRLSNTAIGLLNLLTLLASIPIIGAGLWMVRSTTTCQNFLQTPLLWLGFVVLLVSLAGFIGACFHVAWALWFYLFIMLFLIAGLIGITVFGFVVTGSSGSGTGSRSGRGVPVPGHVYKEYRVGDYSAWMQRKMGDPKTWEGIRSCILGSKTCSRLQGWTPLDYLRNNLTPVQSGCCKPPTSCSYGDATMGMTTTQDPDCYKWSNSAEILCYECDACKAGVMESIRQSWQKLSVLLVVMVVFLIAVYSIGCCAFRNARRAETDYPYGRNRMTKVRPRWDYYWWRWLHDRREQLY